jgi:adenosine/AMP kinase
VEIKLIKIEKPEEVNLIFGQSHFIKTSEDLYEALVTAVPGIKFGLAFSEASGPCLIRTEGTDRKLEDLVANNLKRIGCGHSFLILLKEAYPINVLNAIKRVAEVCQIFCATANSVEVVIGEEKGGRAVLGVIDGASPKGIEKEKDKKERKEFLRKIGYKR